MHDSPRMRRLRNDHLALEHLVSESSVFRFSAHGNPPTQYDIVFHGAGLYRDTNKNKVKSHNTHRIQIKLGSSYPRTIPEIRWQTPIYHPNISEIGMVCLGGYATHWVPSLQLDELCVMLWDMLRYHNYDVRSPYNRDAALWVASQTSILFPTDSRPLRDLRVALGRIEPSHPHPTAPENTRENRRSPASLGARALSASASRVREFIGKRYDRTFGEVLQSTDESAVAAPLPSSARSSGLQDLISAQLHSRERSTEPPPALTPATPSVPDLLEHPDLMILDEPELAPAPIMSRSLADPDDEIRFIE
jgi:ubiquitin-protein ligase